MTTAIQITITKPAVTELRLVLQNRNGVSLEITPEDWPLVLSAVLEIATPEQVAAAGYVAAPKVEP